LQEGAIHDYERRKWTVVESEQTIDKAGIKMNEKSAEKRKALGRGLE